MAYDGINISASKCQLLKIFRPRIEQLFGVKVELVGEENDHDCGSDSPCIEGAKSRKVRISAAPPADICEDERLLRAREYISSVTVAREAHVVVRRRLGCEGFQRLLLSYDDVERECGAVLSFQDDGETVHVSGTMAGVQRACEALHKQLHASQHSENSQTEANLINVQYHNNNNGNPKIASLDVNTEDPLSSSASTPHPLNKHMLLVHTLSPGAESNHDSCYDSDTSPSRSRRSSGQHDGHSDVSRTTSDTLGAELLQDDPQQQALAGNQHNQADVAKVKFALKLGYTPEQLEEALGHVGRNADENELLSALIQLGNGGTGGRDDVDEEDEEEEERITQQTLAHKPGNNLRHIVIDGSNVAMSHGNKEVFSCRGIQLAVDWFLQRGHQEITVFVPIWRKEASRPDAPIKDQSLLFDLEHRQIVVFTPARRVAGRRVVCYDDRYVIKLAAQTDGIVVSNDNYRDLIKEDAGFKKVIEERLLMYSFVNDRFMPPDDPLGRHGPSLNHFLQKEPVLLSDSLPQLCPYAKKCTYGNKCKFYHPERGLQPHKSVTEKLQEQSERRIREATDKGLLTHTISLGDPRQKKSLSPKRPVTSTRSVPTSGKRLLTRTKSVMPPQPSISITEPPPADTKPHEPQGAGLLPCGPPWHPEEKLKHHKDEDNGPLGGHLALAKKLSDEGMSKPQATEPAPPPNRHQKLARQLSLRGSEDPRLQPHPAVYNPVSTSNAAADWYNNSNPATLISPLPRSLVADSPTPSPPPPASPAHRSLKAKASLPLPGEDRRHLPLGRMASAPVTQQNSIQQPQHQHPPIMNRQNSSSDPQINSATASEMYAGDPRTWNFLPDTSRPPPGANTHLAHAMQKMELVRRGHPQQQQQQQQQQPHMLMHGQYPGPPGSGHMMTQQNIHQKYIPIIQPSMQSRNPQLDPSRHNIVSPPPSRIHVGQHMGNMDPQRHGLNPQIDSNPQPQQAPSHHGLSRQMDPNRQQQQQRFTSPIDPSLYNTSPEAPGNSQDNNPEQQPQPQPGDTRNALFFHLCGLFPKEKVVQVMNDYPSETKAEKLCLYIFNMR